MPARKHTLRNAIVTPTLLAAAAATTIYTSANATSSSTGTSIETLDINHQMLCLELGLTPEALAALGVQGHQVIAVFTSLDEEADLVSSLRSQQLQHRDTVSSLKTARAAIRHAESPIEEQQLQASINELQSQATSILQGIDQTEAQIRQRVLPTGTNLQQVSRVCEPTRQAALVPVEFRFADLRDEDFAEIASALAQEQRAQANNEQPDTDTQLILSRYRNLPEVQQARSYLLYNLDAVRGAFSN